MSAAPSAELAQPPVTVSAAERVEITCSCRDCDVIPKVTEAGQRFPQAPVPYQMMHNGLKVIDGGYHGQWMSEIIHRLRGHHEPQEERIFHAVLPRVPAGGAMLEVGGFWAYYSLWFHHAVAGARNYVIEPDPANILVGQRNFELNDFRAEFQQSCIGRTSQRAVPFVCESDGQTREISMTSVDDFLQTRGIDALAILHADVQGAELNLLHGAINAIHQRRIRFVFVSTHHHLISGDPLLHQRCRHFLEATGAVILTDHTVAESYSGDGLLVASYDPRDADLCDAVPISYNRARNSIFREAEYDLAERQQAAPPTDATRPADGRRRLRDLQRWLKRQIRQAG